ncbi:MAG: hypothetical protein GXO23_00960 [Crenarchaeota archaeon]|nr:hypothetical protein [Thermoproteota archaeon]
MTNYYLDYLVRKEFDRRKLYEMFKFTLERLNVPIEDSYELDFLARCAQSDYMHYAFSKMGLYKRLRFDEREARKKVCEKILRNEAAVLEHVRRWTEWWFVKWRQRVRIVFDTGSRQDYTNPEFKAAEDILSKVKKNVLDFYKRLAISALVEQGEVCSLDVMGDYMVKNVALSIAGRYGKDKACTVMATRPDIVRIELVKKAIEIARSSQPYVVLKVKVNNSKNESEGL